MYLISSSIFNKCTCFSQRTCPCKKKMPSQLLIKSIQGLVDSIDYSNWLLLLARQTLFLFLYIRNFVSMQMGLRFLTRFFYFLFLLNEKKKCTDSFLYNSIIFLNVRGCNSVVPKLIFVSFTVFIYIQSQAKKRYITGTRAKLAGVLPKPMFETLNMPKPNYM